MIITTIEGILAVYCDKVIYMFNNNGDITQNLIEKLSQDLGALVKTVYKEISCRETRVTLNSNVLVVRGNTTYLIDYDTLLRNYKYPDIVVACYRGICWTCTNNCNLHTMKLESKWFNYIANKMKVIEGRLYDEKRKRIRVGDCILFKSTSSSNEALLYAVVIGLRRYSSFREMLINEGIERVLPGIHDVDEGVKIYYNYYNPNEEQKYGVLAIEVDLL